MNIGNPAEMTVLEFAETIQRLTGTPAPIVHRPLPVDDPRQRRPDISLAKATTRLGAEGRPRGGPSEDDRGLRGPGLTARRRTGLCSVAGVESVTSRALHAAAGPRALLRAARGVAGRPRRAAPALEPRARRARALRGPRVRGRVLARDASPDSGPRPDLAGDPRTARAGPLVPPARDRLSLPPPDPRASAPAGCALAVLVPAVVGAPPRPRAARVRGAGSTASPWPRSSSWAPESPGCSRGRRTGAATRSSPSRRRASSSPAASPRSRPGGSRRRLPRRASSSARPSSPSRPSSSRPRPTRSAASSRARRRTPSRTSRTAGRSSPARATSSSAPSARAARSRSLSSSWTAFDAIRARRRTPPPPTRSSRPSARASPARSAASTCRPGGAREHVRRPPRGGRRSERAGGRRPHPGFAAKAAGVTALGGHLGPPAAREDDDRGPHPARGGRARRRDARRRPRPQRDGDARRAGRPERRDA